VPHKPGTHSCITTPPLLCCRHCSEADWTKPRSNICVRDFRTLRDCGPEWKTNYEGISLGAYGLRGRTEDIAKLVNSISKEVSGRESNYSLLHGLTLRPRSKASNGSDPNSDFGKVMVTCSGEGVMAPASARAGAGNTARLARAGRCHRNSSGVKDMQAVLNLVWDECCRHSNRVPSDHDSANRKSFNLKLAGLSLPIPKGEATAPLAPKISRKFVFPTNDQKLESFRW